MKSSWDDFFNSLYQYTADAYQATLEPTINSLGQFSGVIEDQYELSTDVFPEDLGMDYYGHYVKITAYTGGFGSLAPPQRESWNGYVFMPGGASGGQPPVIYDQKHGYTDIRLSNILNDTMLGVSGTLATGRMITPMVQVLYRSTNLRQFDFSFFMAPKSRREAQSMKNITKKMRLFAAPQISGGAVVVPAEFKFEFYNKGKLNTNLPKIERCVVTNVTVNYAPQGDFSSFRDGNPVSCLLTFSATETQVIDRNKINSGY